jgi:LCP family protein required for cell wall assembly
MSQAPSRPALPTLTRRSAPIGRRAEEGSPPHDETRSPGRNTRGAARPTSLLTFGLGALLGYGLAGPWTGWIGREAGTLLTGVSAGGRDLGSLIEPLGIGRRRILVMGSDVVGENTDVMFTVQIRDGVTRILQVPRDTYVEAEGLGILKANSLYAVGGEQVAREEVSRLIDAPVDRYLKVNLSAVNRIADELGGVEVEVPKRMYYVDNSQGLYIDLWPGRQLLRGEALEGFLRFRHDEMGDLGRMERQQLVLAEVFRKLVQPTTLARLPALLRIAGEDIRTDLSPLEMTQLLSAMGRTELRTERLPGRLYWQDDLSYWLPDPFFHAEDRVEAAARELTPEI